MSESGSVAILTPDMTQLTPAELDHLANLARLDLSAEEKSRLGQQLPEILDFVDQLQRVKLDSQSPTKRVVELNDLRADEPAETGLTIEQIAALARPDFHDGQVVVPAVFGEENA